VAKEEANEGEQQSEIFTRGAGRSGRHLHTRNLSTDGHLAGRIVGVYATLGVFLIIASRRPLEHLSLIWFRVWSSLVHAGIMAIQSFESAENHGHLIGDVPALLIVGLVLAVLTPRREGVSVTAGHI
jgi:hypothetical protein